MTLVLVVEDDQDIRELLADSLLDLGYDVIEAQDGPTGLAQAQSRLPNVILLDVTMPLMNGFQVLENLMRDPDTQSIPIIMISARGHEHDIKEALRIGASDYLTKPWGPKDLEVRLLRAQDPDQPSPSFH